ncbi:MAG: AEC family transporter [Deferribacterales bacterium]
MNADFNIILNQVITFGILMLVGVIASKTKVIEEESLGYFAKFIVKIILPCLIYAVVAGSGLTLDDILISWRFFVTVSILFFILPIVGFLIGKIFKLRDKSFYVFIALATFGNMGFIGIPLINEVYKDGYVGVSITVYTLVDMSLLWTFGVFLCSKHLNNNSIKNSIKNMINPTTIALVIALALLVLKIKIPSIIANTVYGIGGTSKYLTMIYLGAALSFIDHKGIVRRYHIIALSITKMIIIPVLLYILFKDFLPSSQIGILTIVSGLPTMTTIVMLAKTYGSDDKLATETIFFTTIFSLFSIPLVSLIINFIGG